MLPGMRGKPELCVDRSCSVIARPRSGTLTLAGRYFADRIGQRNLAALHGLGQQERCKHLRSSSRSRRVCRRRAASWRSQTCGRRSRCAGLTARSRQRQHRRSVGRCQRARPGSSEFRRRTRCRSCLATAPAATRCRSRHRADPTARVSVVVIPRSLRARQSGGAACAPSPDCSNG